MTKEIDYVELLKLSHEKLGSQSDMIAELEGKIFKQSQESKDAVSRAIEIILEADAKIAELESNILMLEQYNGSVESLIKDIKAHNLKQQAKGVNDFANKFCGDATTSYQVQLTIDSHCWCEMLDSKALKEQE
jgi:hypothetical protein